MTALRQLQECISHSRATVQAYTSKSEACIKAGMCSMMSRELE